MPVPSPCVSICKVENGRCIGCTRFADEIKDWRTFDDKFRLKIFERCMKDMSDINQTIAQRKMDLWEEKNGN